MNRLVLLSFEQVVSGWGDLQKHLLWPQFEENYTVGWLQEQVARGHLQVWALGEGEMVVLTQIAVLPSGLRALELIWAHGKSTEDYIELAFDTFQRFASFANCKRIDIRGRAGWARKFRKLPGVRTEYIYSVGVPPLEKGH